jgi:hypothetical protein
MLFHAPLMFYLAVRALDEMQIDKVRPEDKAIVSIVFAAASLESFVNELPSIADAILKNGYKDDRIRAFADLMNELEESKASVKSKLVLAKWVLSGVPFDKGSSPFQDISALIDVRNALMHIKGTTAVAIENDKPVFGQPRVLEFLRAKKLLASFPPDSTWAGISWTEAVRTPACAKWACNTAAATALAIVSTLPPDGSWPSVRKVYEKAYRL